MNLKQVNVLLLGLAFHLIFFSFQTSVFIQQTVVNSLISTPNSHFHGNAYLSLCITYSVFALSNWLAPSIIALTGVKYGMILGSCTYILYSASFLFPTTWLFYTAAALIGFGAAPLWTAQGAFLAKQSDSRTASKNAAIFWSMLQSSLLFGNMFVYFAFAEPTNNANPKVNGDESVLEVEPTKISDETRYIVYGVLTFVCTLGTTVLVLLKDGTNAEMSNLTGSIRHKGSKDAESSVESSSQTSSSGVTEMQSISISAWEQFLGALKLSRTTNIILLSVAFLFTGQLLSFFTGVYGTAIGATSQFGDNSKKFIGLAGIAIGIGEISGGALFGLLGSRGLGDKVKRDSVFLLGFLILSCALSLTFVNLPPDSPLTKQSAKSVAIIEPRLWISMIASVLIGFSDACFNTQVYSLLISIYDGDNSVPAFALFKFTQSVGSAIAFLYSTKLDLYYQIAILAATSMVATICFCLAEWRSSAIMAAKRELRDLDGPTASPSSVVDSFSGLEKSESQQSILNRTG